MYLTTAVNHSKAQIYFNWLRSSIQETPIIRAYKGALRAMMAENVNSSLTKYKYFIEGHNMIEKAIEQEKFNWESHFIRFTVQINIPVILNYNNLKEDKSFIISSIFSNYSHCNDKSYINKVILALINSSKLEEIEKLSLLKLIDKEIQQVLLNIDILQILSIIALIAESFLFMEFMAQFTHKYVMHGFLWILHKDHHMRNHRYLEWNDLFALIFAIFSMLLIRVW